MFAEGRLDIWPESDPAVLIEIDHRLGNAERPSEKHCHNLGEAWHPHRGAGRSLSGIIMEPT